MSANATEEPSPTSKVQCSDRIMLQLWRNGAFGTFCPKPVPGPLRWDPFPLAVARASIGEEEDPEKRPVREAKKPVNCANDVGVKGVAKDLEGESEKSCRVNMLGSGLPAVTHLMTHR